MPGRPTVTAAYGRSPAPCSCERAVLLMRGGGAYPSDFQAVDRRRSPGSLSTVRMRRGLPRVALWVWALTGAPALVHAQVQPPAPEVTAPAPAPAPAPTPVPATGSFSGTVTDALTKQVVPDAYV